MLHFEGIINIKAPREKIYTFLTDPNQFSRSLPDLQKMEVVDQDRFNAMFKVGVATIKGTVSLQFTTVERNPPAHAKIKGHGSGLNSSIDLETSFDLSAGAGGTTDMRWVADARVGGLIAGIGSKLMKGATEKQIKKLMESIRKQLEK